MRLLIPLLVFLLIPLSALADSLELASALAQSGSPQLALTHVEAGQPKQQDKTDWLAWERLRLALLVDLGRAEDILQRAAQWSAQAPVEFQREANLAAAQAALKLSRGQQARRYLARQLWQLDPISAAEHARLRRLVLDSYLAEQRAAEAYPVYLRYQQDFPQPDKALLGTLTEAMLAASMAKEAVLWLPQLEEGPLKLLLRLDAGLVSPDAAIAEARRALQKSGSPRYWGVILRAAQAQENAVLSQEARERLLNLPELAPVGPFHVAAQSLWQAYAVMAMDAANQAGLLVGDDAAWMDWASRPATLSLVTARALLAYLAGSSGRAEIRAAAQLKFVALLRQDKLGLTALRLFEQHEAASLPAEARYMLGDMALEALRHADAARFWRGLNSPPDGGNPQSWQLKRGSVFVRASLLGDAEEALQRLLADTAALPAEQAHAALQLLLEMREAGGQVQAERLLQQLLPLAPAFMHKDIRYAQGEIAESAGRHQAAAQAFLQAVMLTGARDPFAQTARLRAAESLARAGLKEDARRQYQQLLKGTKDSAQQGSIRRALAQIQ